MEPITLLYVHEGADCYVYTKELIAQNDADHAQNPDVTSIREVFGEALRTLEILPKEPVTEKLRQESEALTWVNDPFLGLRRAPELEKAAFIVAFTAAWSLLKPLTVAEVSGLHPRIVDAVYLHLNARVFPDPVNSAFFARWQSKRASSPEPDLSPASIST